MAFLHGRFKQIRDSKIGKVSAVQGLEYQVRGFVATVLRLCAAAGTRW